MSAQPTTPEVTTTEVAAPPPDARAEAIALVEKRARDVEAASEETPAEKAPEPAPKEPVPDAVVSDKDKRVGERIAIAKRAELRSAQERERITQERAAIAKEKADIAAERAEIEKIKRTHQLLKEDPAAGLDDLGVPAKDFLNNLADGVPAPAVRQAIQEAREAKAELEKERAQIKREREEIVQAQQQRERDAGVRAAQEQFITHVSEAAERFPHLVEEYTPGEIAARALAVATQHADAYKAQFGEYPDDEVIAQYLEEEAANRAKARLSWREKLGKRAETTSQVNSADQGNGQPLKAGVPRTLTTKAASQKAAAPKPWSEKDAREEAIRLVQQLHSKSDE